MLRFDRFFVIIHSFCILEFQSVFKSLFFCSFHVFGIYFLLVLFVFLMGIFIRFWRLSKFIFSFSFCVCVCVRVNVSVCMCTRCIYFHLQFAKCHIFRRFRRYTGVRVCAHIFISERGTHTERERKRELLKCVYLWLLYFC